MSTHFLLLILTSLPSLRLQGFCFCCRSRISAQQRTVYSFTMLSVLHFTRSFAVFSVMSAHKGILRCKDIWALSTYLHVSLTSHFSLYPIFAMSGIGSEALRRSGLAAFMIGLPSAFSFDSFTNFISLCIIHFQLFAHSFIHSVNTFIHSFLYVIFDLNCLID